MNRSRNGLRALGLCLVALGVMAFGASAAQAAEWKVAGSGLTVEKPVTAKIVSEEGGKISASLLTRIAGFHVKFLCTAGTLVSVSLQTAGKVSAGGKVKFTGCKTTLKTKKEEELGEGGKLSPPCEPHTGANKGEIVTNKGKGQLKEHTTGEGVTVLEAESGETLGVVEMEEECAIGEAVPIIGKLGVVDSGGMTGLLTETKPHKIKEGPLTELWAISKTEEHKAKIIGEAEVELTSGEAWSAKLP